MSETGSTDVDFVTELQEKVRALENENAELKEKSRQTSDLLYEFTKRTLLSSASIQTAVSSMLSDNFLWDGSSDREFLEIIDDSINYICNQLSLESMLLRIQSNKVEIRLDIYPLEEILSGMTESVKKRLKNENIPFSNALFNLAESDKFINADYNYINTGLALCISAITELGGSLVITGVEKKTTYELQISNCADSAIEMINSLIETDTLPKEFSYNRYSNSGLKLLVSKKLLYLQNVAIKQNTCNNNRQMITIALPVIAKSANE